MSGKPSDTKENKLNSQNEHTAHAHTANEHGTLV